MRRKNFFYPKNFFNGEVLLILDSNKFCHDTVDKRQNATSDTLDVFTVRLFRV